MIRSLNLSLGILQPSAGCFGVGRAAAELDLDFESLVFSQNADPDNVAGFEALNGFAEVGDGADVFAIDSNDQIGGTAVEPFENKWAAALTEQGRASDSGLLGSTTGSQTFDQ